jgi:hypothetical protein
VGDRRGRAVTDLKDSTNVEPQPERVLDQNDAAMVTQAACDRTPTGHTC